MPSRRLSSSSSTRLGRVDSHRQDSQKLDVVFSTDPMFVQAGNGKAVPRGLSGVEHDQSAAPVLNFRSDDAYATMSEISRRASAAKEMKAALKAQIAAKRTLESGAADDDDYQAQQSERTVRTVQLSSRDSRQDMPVSGSIRSDRAHSPPQLNSVGNDAGTATAARRAMAAQELKNALEAQMQAKMMLEDDGAAQINESDVSQRQYAAVHKQSWLKIRGLLVAAGPALTRVQAAWELQDVNSSFFNDTRLPSWTQSGLTDAWKQSLRQRSDRRASTPPFAAEYSVSPEAAPPRRASMHSGFDGFPRQPKRPGATESPSPEAKHASGSPFHRSTSRSVTSSPPAGAVGSNPNIGAQTQQPLLRFRSDNHFETSQELVARAERQNRQRAELDAQIAEKQARLEAEQAEASARRSPLANQASRSTPPAATQAPAVAPISYPVRTDSAPIDRVSSRGGSSGHHNGYSLMPAGTTAATVDGSPVQSTAGSGHTHSARENVAPDDSDNMQGMPASKVSTGDRIPLEPTLPQPQPAATASTELPPATAPNMTPQAPAQDGVVQLTPEAQRVKDQEEVYRAWQRAHEEAEQEKRRRTRRHHEIAAQEKREQEEREAAERRAQEERQAAEKQSSNPTGEDQRVNSASTQSGGSSGKQLTSGPAATGRSSVVVPTAATEPKMQTPAVTSTIVPTDAVKPRRGFLCCLCKAG